MSAEPFVPGTAASPPTSLVELSVSCRNLVDKDVLSLSDPQCVLWVKDFGTDSWREFGRTETIKNSLNVDFVHKFNLDYFFEERQHLKFEIFDKDTASRCLAEQELLGRISCTLAEIVSARTFERPLEDCGDPKTKWGQLKQNRSVKSTIIVRAEELYYCKNKVTLQFKAQLHRKGFLVKPSPQLIVFKKGHGGNNTVVKRSEVVPETSNPEWEAFTVAIRTLCGPDYTRPLVIRCEDKSQEGDKRLIGEFTTNLEAMDNCSADRMAKFELVNPQKREWKKKYRNSGECQLVKCLIAPDYTFLDYVAGGTQINCAFAVDLTASNGDPNNPHSLHYQTQFAPSLYARALQAVGEIVQDYDSDKLFPVLGFGACLGGTETPQHCFYLNQHPNDPNCAGIEGVLNAYQESLRSVRLSGPTFFAPVIRYVVNHAYEQRGGSHYFLLLILTDGDINDMEGTKEAIVSASFLPISIIIVGVGKSNFDRMVELDGDRERLSYKGRPAARDIVQFVPYRKFAVSNATPTDLKWSQLRLAQKVLAEVPRQFISFMKMKNFVPVQASRR